MTEQFAVQGALKLKDKTGSSLSSIKGKFTSALKAITKLAIGIGTAMAGAVTVSIRQAAKFEQATLRIMAATTATGDEFDILRRSLEDAARVLGVEFGTGATAAMEALESLVKAGLEGEEAVDALSGALTLAKLEGIDTATAANLMVQAMTMFGIEAKDATKIIDNMSAASDLGISTATGYAQGLSNVGATAANMGISMEETLAALVQMDNTFGDVQSSGTFLNRMLLQLTDVAEEASLEIYNADGSMKGLDEIMTQVRKTLDGFGDDQEKVNEWLGIFDIRAQRALIALANYDESIADTQSSMDEMRSSGEKLDIVMDSFTGQMSILKAKTEDTAISIGETLMPYAMDFLDWIQAILPDVENLIIQFKDVASEVWSFAQNLMKGEWESAYNRLEEIYGNIHEKFMEWWRAIDWDAVWSELQSYIEGLWIKVTTWAGDIAKAFIEWFAKVDWKDVFDDLNVFMEGFFPWLWDRAGDIFLAFQEWANTIDWHEVFKSLATFAMELPKFILTNIGRATVTLGEHIAGYLEDEMPNISKGFDKLVTEVRNDVVKALKAAADLLLDWMPNWLKRLLGLKDIDVPDKPGTSTPPPPSPTPSPVPSPWEDDPAPYTPPPQPTPPPPSGDGDYGGGDSGSGYGMYQSGGHFITKGPTPIMVGEAGPEEVIVNPLHGGAAAQERTGGGDVILNFPEIDTFPENPVMAEVLASIMLQRLDRRRYRRGRWTT